MSIRYTISYVIFMLLTKLQSLNNQLIDYLTFCKPAILFGVTLFYKLLAINFYKA